eukprot:TRINITY_DN773979_c0_g1_i1.p1 TRINITY_DN773979_c0_g1~~TRINITY_DN773979_c0_g1_i1.p1  ORF type:complete len:1113 (+),score=335.62 TRINITY_DN773979_c0_g1_i1:109-3447(+)
MRASIRSKKGAFSVSKRPRTHSRKQTGFVPPPPPGVPVSMKEFVSNSRHHKKQPKPQHQHQQEVQQEVQPVDELFIGNDDVFDSPIMETASPQKIETTLPHHHQDLEKASVCSMSSKSSRISIKLESKVNEILSRSVSSNGKSNHRSLSSNMDLALKRWRLMKSGKKTAKKDVFLHQQIFKHNESANMNTVSQSILDNEAEHQIVSHAEPSNAYDAGRVILSDQWKNLITALESAVFQKKSSRVGRCFLSWHSLVANKNQERQLAAEFYLNKMQVMIKPMFHSWHLLGVAIANHRRNQLVKVLTALKEHTQQTHGSRLRRHTADHYWGSRRKMQTMVRFQKLLHSSRENKALNDKAVSHFNRVASQRGIQTWRSVSQVSARIRSMGALAGHVHIHNTKVTMFKRWKAIVKKNKDKKMADKFYIERMLITGLKRLIENKNEKIDHQMKENQALVYHRYCLLVRSFLKLNINREEGIMEKQATHHRRNALMGNSFSVWKEYCDVRKEKNAMKTVANDHFINQSKSLVFSNWMNVVRLEQFTRKVAESRDTNTMAVSLSNWRMWTRSRKSLRQIGTQIQKNHELECKRTSMNTWLNACEQRESEREAESHNVARQIRQAFEGLRWYVNERRRVSHMKEAADEKLRKTLLQNGINGWLDLHSVFVQEKEREEAAIEFEENRLKHTSLMALQRNVEVARDNEYKAQIFNVRREVSNTLSMLRFWRWWTFRWEDFAHRRLLRVKQNAFSAWIAHHEQKKLDNDARQLSQLYYKQKLMMKSFTNWVDYHNMKKARVEVSAVAVAIYRKNLQTSVINAWRMRALKRRGARNAMKQAFTFSTRNLLQKTFSPWKHYVNRQTELRDHWNQKLHDNGKLHLQFTLTSKSQVVRHLLLKRVFKSWCNNSKARRFNKRNVESRVFHGWHIMTVKHMFESKQRKVASLHFQASLLRRCLSGWKQYKRSPISKRSQHQHQQNQHGLQNASSSSSSSSSSHLTNAASDLTRALKALGTQRFSQHHLSIAPPQNSKITKTTSDSNGGGVGINSVHHHRSSKPQFVPQVSVDISSKINQISSTVNENAQSSAPANSSQQKSTLPQSRLLLLRQRSSARSRFRSDRRKQGN